MSRLNAMRLTVSSTHFLKKMDEFAETFDNILEKGKQKGCEMLKRTVNARPYLYGDATTPVAQQDRCDPQMPTTNQTCTPVNTIHPSQAVTQEKCGDCSPIDAAIINPSNGFSVVVDNWDLRQEVRHMTSDHQNTDIHWVNHNIVENRVSGNHLPDDKPVKNIMDVENKDLIPSIADHKELYNNYLVHIQRILTKRIPSLEGLSSNVPKHIKHKHSEEMSKKSKKVFI